MSNPFFENQQHVTRRHFLGKLSVGLGSAALGTLLTKDLFSPKKSLEESIMAGIPHFAPKAKRVIYLFQNGAPSQLESFDYKPLLNKMVGQELPASIRGAQRLTGMTSGQDKFPLVGSKFAFNSTIEYRTIF